LNGKRLELLKEMLPTISVVAVLSDKLGRNQLTALTHAASALGVKLEPIDVSDSYDFDAEFTRAKAKHAGAVILLGSPAFYVHRARIGSTAAKGGLAVVSPYQEITERGALMSYAADNSDVYFRAASIVDRVLNGANPGDLPIDQVARLRLVVNLKTAKSLRITIPESIWCAQMRSSADVTPNQRMRRHFVPPF
jgi:ABC-type uncharacterized transport system substrate-binding protein